MKIRLLTLLGLFLAIGLHAQDQASGDTPSLRSPEELNELLGPIALYPDPLISLVLPATTVPSDIVLADRFVGGGGDAGSLDDKPWDASVKALTRYPDTLKWLDDNLDWATQVGDAFTNQPDDVMNAIQALRGKAKAVGNLVDTPEQSVVADDNSIRIVPAQPDYLYAPRYDPDVVYDQPAPADDPAIYFSAPYIVGPWLGYDFDWHHHRLYRGEWHRGWDYGRDRGRGGDVFINRSLSSTTVWNVNRKRRIATGAAKASSGRGSRAISGAKVAIVKPKILSKATGAKPGSQPKPAFALKPGGSGKTVSSGKILAPKGPSSAIKGESIKAKGEVLKPKVEAHKEGPKPKVEARKEALKPKIEEHKEAPKPKVEARKEAPKPKVEARKEAPKPKVEARKEAPKPKVEARKEAPKPKVEARKEAPKPKVEAHREAPKPKVEAHREAPKPKVEAHREAPKSSGGGSKDPKKKDKNNQ